MQFCEGYLRSVASREVADFKSTAESQLQHFTVFEVMLLPAKEAHCGIFFVIARTNATAVRDTFW